MDATCHVEDCTSRPKAKGLCKLHYQRFYRTGYTETTRFTPKTCSVDGCDRRSIALKMCGRHYERFKLYGNPLGASPTTASAPGPANSKWLGDKVGYTGAHDRVRKQRGSARNHACSTCGGPAHQWGYDHADPTERTAVIQRRGKEETVAYSPSPEHYKPFCRRCHWAFDHPTGKPTGWRAAPAA